MKTFQEINVDFLEKINSGSSKDKYEAWTMVRSDREFLRWAIAPFKDKWGKDSVNAPHVCEYILLNYEDVDQEIYQQLVNAVYLTENLARTSLDGDRYSFLLMTLYNPSLRLTNMQKDFAYQEAIKGYETIMFANTEVFEGVVCDHGSGSFDIKYWILRNDNWSIEEKKTLIYEFFADQDIYEEFLGDWESNIFEEHSLDVVNIDKYSLDFNQCMMYEYSYEYYLDMYGYNREVTDEVWNEIQFCNLMHILRPSRGESGTSRRRLNEINNED